MKTRASLFIPLILVAIGTAVFAQTRNRPAATGDIKVTYRTNLVAGQTTESVTMIKGVRERSENRMGHGFDQITVTQCDLKRTIQISDATKKYVITPMETGDSSATGPATTNVPTKNAPTRRGGVVNYTSSVVDTGERKEMFGFTARHVKTSMLIQSSADACNQTNQKMEIDGWYIDLNVGLDCNLDRPPVAPPNVRTPQGGCQDQTRFRREGTGKTGFPLVETMKMFGPDGQVQFSTTKEVVELSRQPLDAALFDVPSGYTEAASAQELYAPPSIASMMGQSSAAGRPQISTPANATPAVKQPGSLLIGVIQINNKAGKPVDVESLRTRLVGQLESTGLSAVALNASSQAEAEVEAKAKQCDFILYTDLTTLKMNKLGGMFGAVTGTGMPKTEAKVEFKLFAVGESSPRLSANASAKVEGDDASAGSAIDMEAKAVVTEAKKKKG
jgi:hypothetical protein